MELGNWPTATLVLTGAFVLALYQIRQAWELRALEIRLDCKPPQRLKQSPFCFGVDYFGGLAVAATSHRALEFLRSRYEKHHHTFSLHILGDPRFHTSEPENIKALLSTQFDDFELGEKRYRAFSPLLGNGIFTADGEAWRHSRDMLRPNFTRMQLDDSLADLEDHFQRLRTHLPADDRTVDLQPLFFKLSMDVSTQFLFGLSSDSLLDKPSTNLDGFSNAFEEALRGISFRIRLRHLNGIYTSKKFLRACSLVHRCVDQLIGNALRERKKPSGPAHTENKATYCFLSELNSQVSDQTSLRDHAVNVLVAGRDGTAGLMSLAFFLLSRNPIVLEKLRSEIAMLGKQYPTFGQLKNMIYLQNILKEVLRLYPTTPLNGRSANKDTTLPVGGGPDGKSKVLVRKGQPVTFSVYAMHRRKDLYGEDAHEFRPERWDGLRPGWSYLPFSGGPRSCLGQQFALTESAYIIVRLLQQYSYIESRDSRPFKEQLGLTLASANGCLVAMMNN